MDLDEIEAALKIRDMKHPRKKKGNDVEVQVREEGLAVIRAMPRVSRPDLPLPPRHDQPSLH